MKADTDLERTLRATFAERAESVTDGPLWRGGSDIARQTAGDLVDLTDLRPSRHPSGTGRWRAPALIAAVVVVVAVVASGMITRGFDMPNKVGAAGISPTSSISSTGVVNDATSGVATIGAWPTATVDRDGVITISRGNPGFVLDVYEDALCPSCAEFESRHGTQISEAVDAGLVAVRYRMVDFLNAASASGTYSTRAYAALISVANHDGDRPGVFTQFRAALFQHQPAENGLSDLSDDDLAALAAGVGASTAAQQEIANGSVVAAAKVNADSNMESLKLVAASVGRGPGTPTVAVDGRPIVTNEAGWLADLMAQRHGGGAETQTGGSGR